MSIKVFSGQKKVLGAPKMKKINFLKNIILKKVHILETIDFQNN